MLWKGRHIFNILEAKQYRGLVQMPSGNTYYVDPDHSYASDAHRGTDPDRPLSTIQAAIDLCTDFNQDFIFVQRRLTTDITTTTPILMNKHTVHLVAVSNPNPQGALVRLVHTNATDNIIEFPQDSGYHCEVAGFGFAGGATEKGGIASTGQGGGHVGVWVHHCNFGGLLTKGTPDYGIFDPIGGEMMSWTIEDNSFYGSGDNAKGLIAVDGILAGPLAGSGSSKHLIIRRNIFMGIPGVAISIRRSSGVMILSNSIKMDAAHAGAAITLDAGCLGCWVSWNDSNIGSTDAQTNGGYRDLAAGDANTWSSNWCGGVVAYPAAS